jgi:hypothetical protein
MGFFILRVKPFKFYGLLDPEVEGNWVRRYSPRDMVSHL